MNAAATTSYNAAAQNIKVNRKMRTLEISKTFEKAASRYGSDEYIALMHAQMENPGYSVKVVTRKGGSKQPYAGLTFEYMKKYISILLLMMLASSSNRVTAPSTISRMSVMLLPVFQR